MTNEVINVEGMSCDHCKHSIEKALNGLDGVTSSEVSLANGNVEVEFDENQVDFPKNIENNINNLYLIIMLFGIINLFLIFAVCKKGKYQEKVIELTNNVDKAKNKLDNITYEIKKVKKDGGQNNRIDE